jgi:hypothetical protein
LELALIPLSQILSASKILRSAMNLELDFWKGVLQPPLNQADCQVCNINPNPTPIEFLRSVDGRAATTKGVKHCIAFIRRNRDHPFQQCELSPLRLPS